jgi:hypothetical protein
MSPKSDLPEWFPFAVAASFLVMIGAGIKSGWKTSSAPKPPPQPQPVAQAGVLQDWATGDYRI